MEWIISDFAPIIGLIKEQTRPVSRTSPQLDGDVLYFGTLTHTLIVAVNRFTGEILGTIQLNSHPFAVVTMSPTFYDGKLFVGTASDEGKPTLLPTISVAPATIECQKQNFTSCLPSNIWQESVLAIGIDRGTVNWIHQPPPLDAYSAGCGYAGIVPQTQTLCPEVPGLDADFGMAPSFVTGSSSTPQGKDTIVVRRKNGKVYAMSAQSGKIFWTTATSPSGIGGGLSWGIAADDNRVYFTAINSGEVPWRLVPSNESTNRSAYGVTSLKTGSILWETAVPSNGVAYKPPTIVCDWFLLRGLART
ncbi:Quino protein alcohol dehydrogenase-like protein [Acephala macrosclerotiorum]|nr:Quino protein alcohol dehydrogenase-like protein [Acephala macrosclerotiorum]